MSNRRCRIVVHYLVEEIELVLEDRTEEGVRLLVEVSLWRPAETLVAQGIG